VVWLTGELDMEATETVRPDTPGNAAEFRDPFFARFSLRPGPKALDLPGDVRKTYSFPTLYKDVGCAIGIFLCDYGAARALMPSPKLIPLKMPKGRTAVIFSCYEYRQVFEVWPYNEIAMTIPVMANASVHLPVLPLVASGLFPRFGYHVFSMPVTSKENQLRGNTYWGLPKVTQRIDIERSGSGSSEDCVTRAFESDGRSYFELRVPTGGTPTDFDVRGYLYPALDGKVLKAETRFKGRFNVTKHLGTLLERNKKPDREYLILGDGPSAKPLRDLGIEPHPLQFRYTPSMNAAFDLPIEGFDIER
jgi:hypothetical protein